MRLILKTVFLLVTALLLGGVVHIGSLLAVPYVSTQDAFSRISALTQPNSFVSLDPLKDNRRLPLLDPAFAYLACPFDLSDGPVRVRVPLSGEYVAMSFYAPDAVAFFSINDQSASDAAIEVDLHDPGDASYKPDPARPSIVPLAAPDLRGFVMVRAFAPTDSVRPIVQAALAGATCESLD
jgi:uncharacterized membrane protein